MFKDLILNRDSINLAIDAYCKENYTSYSIEMKEMSSGQRYSITTAGSKLVLDVYYNNKGGTTFAVNSGKPALLEDRKKLAQYIIDSPLCAMASGSDHNRSMLFKNIDREDFNAVIDAICEEDDFKSLISRDEINGCITVKMEGRWSDKVTVTYYVGTKNVRIQGRPLILYALCSSMFNELVDVDEVVECLDEAYSLNLSGKTVEEQYDLLLPKSHDKHTAKLKKSLLKAVYNLNLNQHEYGCTELVFEALRALEGHIKLTLVRDYSIKCPNKFGTLTFFSYDSTAHIVNINAVQAAIISDATKLQYYKDAYKFFVEHRHKIFHWDYPDTVETDSTEQLDNIEDVHRIIRDTLALIDRYY